MSIENELKRLREAVEGVTHALEAAVAVDNNMPTAADAISSVTSDLASVGIGLTEVAPTVEHASVLNQDTMAAAVGTPAPAANPEAVNVFDDAVQGLETDGQIPRVDTDGQITSGYHDSEAPAQAATIAAAATVAATVAATAPAALASDGIAITVEIVQAQCRAKQGQGIPRDMLRDAIVDEGKRNGTNAKIITEFTAQGLVDLYNLISLIIFDPQTMTAPLPATDPLFPGIPGAA